jgi:diguanylate cyclase (GGDEF)-like protein
MLTVIACITRQHDLWLVGFGLIICLLSSYGTLALLRYAGRRSGAHRRYWLAVASIAGGTGIWATHFVAMLAFRPGLPVGYDLWLTGLSWIIAITFVGLGLLLGVASRSPLRVASAGAMVGLAISLMHYTGMSAFHTTGRVVWNHGFIAASVAAAVVFSALAFVISARVPAIRGKLLATACFTLAICLHHFTAMTAVTILPDASRLQGFLLPAAVVAILVGASAVIVVTVAFTAAKIDRRLLARQKEAHDLLVRTEKAYQDQLDHLAFHDSLTGLANRAKFEALLSAALDERPEGDWVALIYCDLDRFKDVNDQFGHAAGDGVLKEFASIVSAMLSKGEVFARTGGDEFAIVLRGQDRERLATLCETICTTINERSADRLGNVGVSIGAALAPDHAGSVSDLSSAADVALYRAKQDGRRGWRLYDRELGSKAQARRALEIEIRLARSRGELSLVYQPQTDLMSGRITGFEVLLRWQRASGEHVSPTVFIPIAEECGAISEIGEWVLRSACSDAVQWPNPLGIAVNVSPVQLHNPGFVDLVQRLLAECGLCASRLELEVTETALIKDFDRAIATLRGLKALGIRIAMDDFGTGYSSLSNLRAFPFDKIKIDRSFVQAVDENAQASAIVRAVLGLGQGLNLPVLAEGVETQTELDFLRREGCDQIQGYLLSRPLPISSFTHWTGMLAQARAAEAQIVTAAA